MMNKYKIFFGDKMGCATLGYCEREGRDRDEEHRRYAEFLVKEGYTVLSCEGGTAMIAVDAGGIVRTPAPDPEERFPSRTLSRRELAEAMSRITSEPVPPGHRALTAELCQELAEQLGGFDDEDGGWPYSEIKRRDAILTDAAEKAGLATK